MGKKSIKENKNVYQLAREELNLTRAQASEILEFITESRIEKIESEKSLIQPEEVMAMAKAYKKPLLCNTYCSHDCPIGQTYVPEITINELPQIVLKMLASLNNLNESKNKLIEISSDGQISDNELLDFVRIQKGLEEISLAADALNLWINNTIASGAIDEDKLRRIKESLENND